MTKFYISILQDTFVNRVGRRKIKKKYYDKYVTMLTIHLSNHFSDKYVTPCQVTLLTVTDES